MIKRMPLLFFLSSKSNWKLIFSSIAQS